MFLRSNGNIQWGTKPFEIWLVIMLIQKIFNPRNILEFGSGRSTNFFAEYAYKTNKKFISIEQNKGFMNHVNKGLKISNLPQKFLHHVPIKNDWFDLVKIKNILGDISSFDLIMIDAPGGVTNKSGSRGSIAGAGFISEFSSKDSIIIIDDSHREDVYKTIPLISKNHKICTIKYLVNKQSNSNSISFLLPLSFEDSFDKILGLALADSRVCSITKE